MNANPKLKSWGSQDSFKEVLNLALRKTGNEYDKTYYTKYHDVMLQ